MVLACESIFSRTSLDGRPLAHILISKPEIYKMFFPSGASKMQFSLAPQL